MNSIKRKTALQIAGIIVIVSFVGFSTWLISRRNQTTVQIGSNSTPGKETVSAMPLPVTGGPKPGIYLPLVISAPKAAPAPPVPISYSSDPVLVGAGDIARCNVSGDEATAALVKQIPGTVMAIGDTAYSKGSSSDFKNCYDPSWGTFKDRTRPAVGNHEYMTSGAAPYYAYFGTAAGPSGKGYYSYDLGKWHIIVLNSECSKVPGGCGAGSPQESWLKQDLVAHPTQCSLAYYHEPMYSSGEHGNNTGMKTMWADLYNAGVELVLNGHDHDYERFTPMDANGKVDKGRGIQEIVVGTGGGNQRPWGSIKANSAARINNVYGVIKLTLHANSYDWQFIPQAGKTTSDSGSATCH